MPRLVDRAVSAIFSAEFKTFPNQAVINNLLNDGARAKLWEIAKGNALMLVESNCDDPYIFVAGTLDAVAVYEISELCQTSSLTGVLTKFPMLYCNGASHHLFLQQNWDLNLRVQLSYNPPLDHSLIYKNIKKERIIVPIDNMSLFKKCTGFKSTSERYGSADRFLKYGEGYALLESSDIVSEAYIDYGCNNYAEIGVVTHPKYYGQGAATQVASYLVAKSIEKQKVPVWSCQINNRASLKTAFKVGFIVERYYLQLVPDVGNTWSPKLEKWLEKNRGC